MAGERKKQMLENSDDEDDVPLAELQKRFRFSHNQDEDEADYTETECEEESSDQYSYDETLGTQLMGNENETLIFKMRMRKCMQRKTKGTHTRNRR